MDTPKDYAQRITTKEQGKEKGKEKEKEKEAKEVRIRCATIAKNTDTLP